MSTAQVRRIEHPTVGAVETRVEPGASVTFLLDADFDPETGRIDLTDLLAPLVVLGLQHPYREPEGAVPLGLVETSGGVVATHDGRELSEAELLETVGAGFVHAITDSLNLVSE
jgi:hypothetical protein